VSAPFGQGKSWFINHFFNESGFSQEFNLVHLYPVNYSVASNRDAFELIKYDILFELAIANPQLLSPKFADKVVGKLSNAANFVKNNCEKITRDVLIHALKEFAHIDKVIPETVLNELLQSFDESNAKELDDFTKRQITQVGSIYEKNIITKLINDELARIKEVENASKRNVLIIDDLDRIDPEHIFRLLNVFSAHIDQKDSEASFKFNFDHVIFVCDIENVKDLFKQRYGSLNSWQGYINKFYTNGYFVLKNNPLMQYFYRSERNKLLDSMMNQVTWLNSAQIEYVLSFAHELIEFLMDKEMISFRHLKHLQDIQLNEIFNQQPPFFPYSEGGSTSMHPFIPLWIGLLMKLMGGSTELTDFMVKNREMMRGFELQDKEFYLQVFLPISQLKESSKIKPDFFSNCRYAYYDLGSRANGFNLIEEFVAVLKKLPQLSTQSPENLFSKRQSAL
jgi:hypothetical protein